MKLRISYNFLRGLLRSQFSLSISWRVLIFQRRVKIARAKHQETGLVAEGAEIRGMKTLARIAKMSENKGHYANEESTVGRENPGSRWEWKTMVNARGL